VVVVDLDNNTVTVPEASGPLPAPPPRRAAKLRAALRQHGGAFERRGARWAEDALSSWDHAFAYGPRPDFDESPFGDAAAASATAALPAPPQWPEVREAFLRFFVALLRDYRKHLVYPSKEEPEPVDVFANAAYLASQAPDSTGFLTELVAAQGFQSFCAARVSQDPEDSEVIFFDESIDAKCVKRALLLLLLLLLVLARVLRPPSCCSSRHYDAPLILQPLLRLPLPTN